MIEETSIIGEIAESTSIEGQIVESTNIEGIVAPPIELICNILATGPKGLPGTDAFYTHIQEVPSDTWIIDHNLNKYPSITVVDSAGNVVICEVEYVSLNRIVCTFVGGNAGKAHLN